MGRMKIFLDGLSPIKELLYTDEVIVSRSKRVQNPDGTTGNKKYVEVGRYPCNTSFGENDDSTHDTDVIVTGYLPIKLFVRMDSDIIKGDKVQVNITQSDGTISQTYKGIANKPAVHNSHKEVSFVDTGEA